MILMLEGDDVIACTDATVPHSGRGMVPHSHDSSNYQSGSSEQGAHGDFLALDNSDDELYYVLSSRGSVADEIAEMREEASGVVIAGPDGPASSFECGDLNNSSTPTTFDKVLSESTHGDDALLAIVHGYEALLATAQGDEALLAMAQGDEALLATAQGDEALLATAQGDEALLAMAQGDKTLCGRTQSKIVSSADASKYDDIAFEYATANNSLDVSYEDGKKNLASFDILAGCTAEEEHTQEEVLTPEEEEELTPEEEELTPKEEHTPVYAPPTAEDDLSPEDEDPRLAPFLADNAHLIEDIKLMLVEEYPEHCLLTPKQLRKAAIDQLLSRVQESFEEQRLFDEQQRLLDEQRNQQQMSMLMQQQMSMLMQQQQQIQQNELIFSMLRQADSLHAPTVVPPFYNPLFSSLGGGVYPDLTPPTVPSSIVSSFPGGDGLNFAPLHSAVTYPVVPKYPIPTLTAPQSLSAGTVHPLQAPTASSLLQAKETPLNRPTRSVVPHEKATLFAPPMMVNAVCPVRPPYVRRSPQAAANAHAPPAANAHDPPAANAHHRNVSTKGFDGGSNDMTLKLLDMQQYQVEKSREIEEWVLMGMDGASSVGSSPGLTSTGRGPHGNSRIRTTIDGPVSPTDITNRVQMGTDGLSKDVPIPGVVSSARVPRGRGIRHKVSQVQNPGRATKSPSVEWDGVKDRAGLSVDNTGGESFKLQNELASEIPDQRGSMALKTNESLLEPKVVTDQDRKSLDSHSRHLGLTRRSVESGSRIAANQTTCEFLATTGLSWTSCESGVRLFGTNDDPGTILSGAEGDQGRRLSETDDDPWRRLSGTDGNQGRIDNSATFPENVGNIFVGSSTEAGVEGEQDPVKKALLEKYQKICEYRKKSSSESKVDPSCQVEIKVVVLQDIGKLELDKQKFHEAVLLREKGGRLPHNDQKIPSEERESDGAVGGGYVCDDGTLNGTKEAVDQCIIGAKEPLVQHAGADQNMTERKDCRQIFASKSAAVLGEECLTLHNSNTSSSLCVLGGEREVNKSGARDCSKGSQGDENSSAVTSPTVSRVKLFTDSWYPTSRSGGSEGAESSNRESGTSNTTRVFYARRRAPNDPNKK